MPFEDNPLNFNNFKQPSGNAKSSSAQRESLQWLSHGNANVNQSRKFNHQFGGVSSHQNNSNRNNINVNEAAGSHRQKVASQIMFTNDNNKKSNKLHST